MLQQQTSSDVSEQFTEQERRLIVQFCSWWRPSWSKRSTINLLSCYLNCSDTSEQAFSVMQHCCAMVYINHAMSPGNCVCLEKPLVKYVLYVHCTSFNCHRALYKYHDSIFTQLHKFPQYTASIQYIFACLDMHHKITQIIRECKCTKIAICKIIILR